MILRTKIITALITLLPFFNFLNTEAQICNGLHPNNQSILQTNNVKKVTRYHTDNNTGKTRITAIHYLDSTGCAWRYIYYDRQRKEYKVREQKGHYTKGKTESYFGFFNADSVEVMISRDIHYHNSANWLIKEERFLGGANIRHIIIYHNGRNPNTDRETYTLNAEGDTLSFDHWIQNIRKSARFRKEKKDGVWKVTENDSTIRTRNKFGEVVLENYYEDGTLTGGKKVEFIYSGEKIEETKEYDLNGNLLREIVTDGWNIISKEYKDGKLINTEEPIPLPIADPIDEEPLFTDDIIDLSKVLGDISKKDTVKNNDRKVLPKPGENKEPKDTVMVHYHDPMTKAKIKSKEIFSSTGLILEIQQIWKNETETFEYEYFNE